VSSQRSSSWFHAKWPWLLGAVLIAAVGAVVLGRVFDKPMAEREQSGVLLHLKSKLGEEAPSFTLADSEGVEHRVTPGGGKPTVIVFHMGSR
jgi:Tfp pilus assembly protein PilN